MAFNGLYMLLSILFVELKEDSIFDGFLERLLSFRTSTESMSPLSFWSLDSIDESMAAVDPHVEILETKVDWEVQSSKSGSISIYVIFRNIGVWVRDSMSVRR